MRSTPSRRRLVSTWRRIRAAPRPWSAPSSIGLKVLVAITTRSRASGFVRSHAPMYSSLRPQPVRVGRVERRDAHAPTRRRAAGMPRRASVPLPTWAGDEPMPPKFPQPRMIRDTAMPLRPSCALLHARSYAAPRVRPSRIGLAAAAANTAGWTTRGSGRQRARRASRRRRSRRRSSSPTSALAAREPARGLGALRPERLVAVARRRRSVGAPRRDVLRRPAASRARPPPPRGRERHCSALARGSGRPPGSPA